MEMTSSGSRALENLLIRLKSGLQAVGTDVLSFLDPLGVRRFRKIWGLGLLVASVDRDGSITWFDGEKPIAHGPMATRITDQRLVALRLEDTEVLKRIIDLPAAAARRLEDVLPLNIGAWTPFSAKEVFAAARVIGPGAGRGQESVEVRCALQTMVHRKIVDLGVQPDSVHLGMADFESKIETPKRRRFFRVRALMLALAAVLLLQSLVLVALLMAGQDQELSSLESRRASLTRIARARADAAKRMETQQSERVALSQKLSEAESLTSRLGMLVEALPNGSVVRELAFSRERGGGHMVVIAPSEFDVAAALQARQFRVHNLTMSGATDGNGQTYAVEFLLSSKPAQERQ